MLKNKTTSVGSAKSRRKTKIKIRKGQGSVRLSYDQFVAKNLLQFNDAYDDLSVERDAIINRAWEIYSHQVESERQVPAGSGFKHPDFEVSATWLQSSREVKKLSVAQKKSKPRVLIINGSPRSDNTCPQEMSKTHRLCEIAIKRVEAGAGVVDYLDLSQVASEYAKKIYPCKGCVSTAMPLCHWPCSCYPNHVLSQTQDWMQEIYEKWVSAHGVMIITPVHWYSPTSVLKLMMDRMVCADGGNPDFTSTKGKTPELAKAMELAGWDYPKHLAGRKFSVIVHGDTVGATDVRRALVDWLQDLQLESVAHEAELDRYIGYYESYAESHEHLDKDKYIQEEVAVAAELLLKAVKKERQSPHSVKHIEIRPK